MSNKELGKLLKDVCRHKAKEFGVEISADGWVRVSDALVYVNSFGHAYTVAEVRDEVVLNPKKRFQLREGAAVGDSEPLIRAAQGHSMEGVAEQVGVRLTRETAPEIAVHGTYVKSVPQILRDGLKKMGRHHIHLARGLLGEDLRSRKSAGQHGTVISGMRRTAEVHVWVRVQDALDAGINFFESANGVILCEGFDGVLPPEFISVVIEMRGGLQLAPAQVHLIERLFAGCQRVVVTKLHGGFSGSLVLQTDSYGAGGRPDEPTVTKIDSGDAMRSEMERTTLVGRMVGASAARTLRGPRYADAGGNEIDGASAGARDFGAAVIEMAGACWVLPEFWGKLQDVDAISTFKSKVVSQLEASTGGHPGVRPNSTSASANDSQLDAAAVFRDLWGAGGPLTSMALKSALRDDVEASEPGGFLEATLRDLAERAVIAFVPPEGGLLNVTADEKPQLAEYVPPETLQARLDELQADEQLKLDFGSLPKRDKFADSFVLDCAAAGVWDDNGCAPLVKLLSKMHGMLRTEAPAWLAEWRPLLTQQHGDLNCGNILVDVRGTLWLIDFAKAGLRNQFVDAAKMVSVLLFEHFPIPHSLQEIRAASLQKLKDAFSVRPEAALKLRTAAESCETVQELRAAVAGDDELRAALGRRAIADETVSQARMREAFAIIDLLVDPMHPKELWELTSVAPPETWARHAQLTWQLLTTVIQLACNVVMRSGQRAPSVVPQVPGAPRACEPADLHVGSFLLRLLHRALCSIRYSGLSVWQHRLAWYTVQRCSQALCVALPRAPRTPPEEANAGEQIGLFLAESHLVLISDDRAGRLGGGEGAVQLALVQGSSGGGGPALSTVQVHRPATPVMDTKPLERPSIRKQKTVGRLLRNHSRDTHLTDTTDVLLFRASEKVLPMPQALTSEAIREVEKVHDYVRKVVMTLLELQRLVDQGQATGDELEQQLNETLDMLQQAGALSAMSCWEQLNKARTQVAEARKGAPRERQARMEAAYVAKLAEAASTVFGTLEEVERSLVGWLRTSGAAAMRRYAVGMELVVLYDNVWYDASVAPTTVAHVDDGTHRLWVESSEQHLRLMLHPFNHAPRLVRRAQYAALLKRYAFTLKTTHSTIVDALSGRRLDVLDQCVPLELVDADASRASEVVHARPSSTWGTGLSSVSDVKDLARWFQRCHLQRRNSMSDGLGGELFGEGVLLTAGPAAGKTCLMSQLVMHLFDADGDIAPDGLVPVLVKVQNLQRRLLDPDAADAFATAWNWVDAYLQCELGAGSEELSMLQQAMLSRRALLLLDGLDEGGTKRAVIEKHVAEVLRPQGFLMIVTARPTVTKEMESIGKHFSLMSLKPLSEAQQAQVIRHRVGPESAPRLIEYVEQAVPVDEMTNTRVTANPLLLSMVCSIHELREEEARTQAADAMPSAAPSTASRMPLTVAKLYASASNMMLEHVDRKERGAAASVSAVPKLRSLLEAIFFQAHASGNSPGDSGLRVIGPDHIEAAALDLEDAPRLAAIRWPQYDGPPREGHYVQVVSSDVSTHIGRFATVQRVQGTPPKCAVKFADDGKSAAWVKVRSTGLSRKDFQREHSEQRQRERVKEAMDDLPQDLREAMRTVRERVVQDRLPLLSLLHAEPLEMQSSHLSFQEFFTAGAICNGWLLPSTVAASWQWSSWWLNVIKLGSEMGAEFGRGLLQSQEHGSSARLTAAGRQLDLSESIGGHRQTALLSVGELMRAVVDLRLVKNRITSEETRYLKSGLRLSRTLTALNISENELRDAGIVEVMLALHTNMHCKLESLDVTYNSFAARGMKKLAGFVAHSKTLVELSVVRRCQSELQSLMSTNLSPSPVPSAPNTPPKLIAALCMAPPQSNNQIGFEGALLVALMLDPFFDETPPCASTVEAPAVNRTRSYSITHSTAARNKADGPPTAGSPEVAPGKKSVQLWRMENGASVNKHLTSLDLSGTNLTPVGGMAMAHALGQSPSLVELNLTGSGVGEEGLRALGIELHSNPESHLCCVACDAFDLRQQTMEDCLLDATLDTGGAMLLSAVALTHKSLRRLELSNGVEIDLARLKSSTTPVIRFRSDGLSKAAGVVIGCIASSNPYITSIVFASAGGDEKLEVSLAQLHSTQVLSHDFERHPHAAYVAGCVLGVLARANTQLARLNLKSGTFVAADMQGLRQVLSYNTSLRSVCLANCQLGDGVRMLTDALRFNRHSQVEQLELPRTGINEKGARDIAQCVMQRSLTMLDLSGNEIDGDAISELAEAVVDSVSLTSLKLDMRMILVRELRGDDGVESLDVSAQSMSKQSGFVIAKLIARNTSAVRLDLHGNTLGDQGVSAIAESLRPVGAPYEQALRIATLNLSNNDVGEAGVKAVASALLNSTMIKSLDLSKNDLSATSSDIAALLRSNTTLNHLNLGAGGLGEEGWKSISAAMHSNGTLCSLEGEPGVEWLFRVMRGEARAIRLDLNKEHLSNIALTFVGALLSTDTALRHLTLPTYGLSKAALEALSKGLADNSTLLSLDANSMNLGDVGATILKKAVMSNRGLTSLSLCDNNIGEDGGRDFLGAMANNTSCTVQSLDLSENPALGWNAGDGAARLLRNSRTIKHIGLSGCGLGDSGWSAFATALRANTSLTSLRGPVGVEHFFTQLRSGDSPTSLDLSNKGVRDAASVILAELIACNSTLTSIDLRSNKLTEKGVEALNAALGVNEAINSVDLRDNPSLRAFKASPARSSIDEFRVKL